LANPCLDLGQANVFHASMNMETKQITTMNRVVKTLDHTAGRAALKFRIFGRRTAVLFCVMVLHSVSVKAVGYRLPNQDPEAIGRGNAFVATADNPSAIYYNPAGISQLEGQEIGAGVYLVSGGYNYDSPGGASARANSNVQPVPQLYYVVSPEDFPLSFGLGVYAPYGLSLDWSQQSPHETMAQKGSILYLCFNPVVSWKIHRTLSIAIGPTINYSSAEFERAIGLFPNDQFRVDGDGMGYGFNAGILWQPLDQWSFGVNYRYTTTVDYRGSSATLPSPPYPASTSSSASILFPQYVVAGVSFRPTENWNLEFDLDWTDWNAVKQIVFKGTAFGNLVLPLNYQSSFMYEFGATRQLGRGYYGSLGFFYSQNSSPDKNFTPTIPDSDLYLGSVGLGHKGKHWDWAAAYQFGYNPARNVQNDQSAPLADGTYHIFNEALNVSVTLKF
jgi:long-chain fatty acid transport protein